MAEEKLYLIFAENFYDLVFAVYLNLLGKKVRVSANRDSLENASELIPLDPFRSQLLAGRLGLPIAKEKDPYVPDFQIISQKYRLDFFWDRYRRDFSFNRDLGQDAEKFSNLLNRLVKTGRELELAIQNLPLIAPKKNAEFFLNLLSRAKTFPDQNLQLKSVFASAGISSELSQILIAPLRIISPHFSESSSFLSASIIWRFILSGAEGIVSSKESLASFMEILTASKSLILEEPLSIEISAGKITELRLHSGRRIQADLFFASPPKILELLNEKDRESRKAKSLAERFPRSTIFSHFYEIKSDALPEAMAERVIWISARTEDPKEFLLCSKPLTGALNLICISYARRKGEAKPLNEEDLLQTLLGLFPWTKAEPPKKRKEPLGFHQYLKLEPVKFYYPQLRTSFSNLFLTPSELIPILGFPGLFRFAERLAEEEKDK